MSKQCFDHDLGINSSRTTDCCSLWATIVVLISSHCGIAAGGGLRVTPLCGIFSFSVTLGVRLAPVQISGGSAIKNAPRCLKIDPNKSFRHRGDFNFISQAGRECFYHTWICLLHNKDQNLKSCLRKYRQLRQSVVSHIEAQLNRLIGLHLVGPFRLDHSSIMWIWLSYLYIA